MGDFFAEKWAWPPPAPIMVLGQPLHRNHVFEILQKSTRSWLKIVSNTEFQAVPRRTHEPPRGALPVRALGGHKANEEG